MSELDTGDVVRLKSGGPKMTVKEIGRYGYDETKSAACQWFKTDKAPWEVASEVFPLTSLEKSG